MFNFEVLWDWKVQQAAGVDPATFYILEAHFTPVLLGEMRTYDFCLVIDSTVMTVNIQAELSTLNALVKCTKINT